ncbi:tRNA(Ile)-lysidine synthetase [Treponema sp. OMZ 838]|uniref:tRNA lysidine(34) synthetase TilS n=1 Tax=Treponema sp. OMZ 838 TaxID=1539298 RepID=UPI000530143E|nr:tRNA lysidine(34) synthetase TilS [Treponema sp. OMZ 838]AIW90055.1 tRNA(Ile)-lysidine synthetase [Treponema sp. OMZ 838]
MNSHPLIDVVFNNLKPFLTHIPCRFLLACSGGADSTALLLAFHRLQTRLRCRLTVVTVNHNIRSAEESAADSAFVAELCSRLDPPVSCVIAEIPAGEVARYTKERNRGTEDAARTLRYRLFEETAASVGADYIVTAHNLSDVYETVLMRLFQGGSTASLSVMPVRRGRYLRPLITVERSDIEVFLRQQGIGWREDSTNAEDTYLRNRIRHHLVPALAAAFGGWRTGLDKTLQRISLDRSFCEEALITARKTFIGMTGATNAGGTADWKQCKHGALTIAADFFDSLHPALRLRVLEQGCRRLGIGTRVPLGILLRLSSELTEAPEILKGAGQETAAASDVSEAVLIVQEKQPDTRSKIAAAGALRLERRGDRILLFDSTAYLTLYNQKSYSLTIPQCGIYAYPLGQLEVYQADNGIFVRDSTEKSSGIGPFTLPIFVRSRRGGDRIQMKSGNVKEVKKILNEWQVDSLARELLPIIIEDTCIRRRTRIRALYGSFLGYKNWFVEEQ